MFDFRGLTKHSKQASYDRGVRVATIGNAIKDAQKQNKLVDASELMLMTGVSVSTLKKYMYELGYKPVSAYAKGWEGL